jgi:hypothetical protein
MARTLDQAKAVMTFIDAVTEKNLRYTVSLTAGRGRVIIKNDLFIFIIYFFTL